MHCGLCVLDTCDEPGNNPTVSPPRVQYVSTLVCVRGGGGDANRGPVPGWIPACPRIDHRLRRKSERRISLSLLVLSTSTRDTTHEDMQCIRSDAGS